MLTVPQDAVSDINEIQANHPGITVSVSTEEDSSKTLEFKYRNA